MIQRSGETSGGGNCRRQGGGIDAASHGNGDVGEASRSGPGTGGSYDGGLGLSEEPLNGLTVRFVTELTSQLKDTCSANDGHTDSPTATVYFAVTVLGGRLLDGKSRGLLSLGVYNSAVSNTVSGRFGIRHGEAREGKASKEGVIEREKEGYNGGLGFS